MAACYPGGGRRRKEGREPRRIFLEAMENNLHAIGFSSPLMGDMGDLYLDCLYLDAVV